MSSLPVSRELEWPLLLPAPSDERRVESESESDIPLARSLVGYCVYGVSVCWLLAKGRASGQW